ncbi:MAG: hypothetical protein Q8M26_08705 [Pseudolabrys sp.]|nr:hypothetical protein [Pseudolabrys sp.]
MASPALQSMRQTITVAWPKKMDAEAKAFLLKTAREGHAAIMQRQGNPSFEAYANRPGNRNLDSVVLPGPVVYNYSNIRQLVEFALDELRKASPVGSGSYVRSHTLYVNGVEVGSLPPDIKPTDEIMIANPIAYARRLEIGKTTAGRDFVVQVPNRIYERVAKQKVIPRYRNVAKVTFAYINTPDAYATKGGLPGHFASGKSGPRGGGTRVKRRQRAGSTVMAPAIIIRQIVER